MTEPDPEIPDEISRLIHRCESGESSFDNDDMSAALMFGTLLWRRLTRLSEHYEHQSGNFMPGDTRAVCMRIAAAGMRHVLIDTQKDCT